jgi:hypothetical protein
MRQTARDRRQFLVKRLGVAGAVELAASGLRPSAAHAQPAINRIIASQIPRR